MPQSFRDSDRDTPPPHSSLVVANVKIPSSPPTSVESYQSGTGCRSDGRGSGASSHHELDTLANEYASTISLCEFEQPAKNPSPSFSKSSGRSHAYLVHLSLHFLGSPAAACLLHLHTNAALYSHTIPSIAARTSGSIGTSSITISPVG